MLGGTTIFGGVPTVVALSNTWIVINAGGGPTDDKPTVTLETPRDPDRVNSFHLVITGSTSAQRSSDRSLL
ncbi:hypothetical protein ABZ646_24645 [Streptomyces sp. NPDC007162]|uniref:hypothetical protein n=1 Tax=Streptomyces sp. NPDC007162 TaxID=3156917 RepID=UPI0033D1E6B7